MGVLFAWRGVLVKGGSSRYQNGSLWPFAYQPTGGILLLTRFSLVVEGTSIWLPLRKDARYRGETQVRAVQKGSPGAPESKLASLYILPTSSINNTSNLSIKLSKHHLLHYQTHQIFTNTAMRSPLILAAIAAVSPAFAGPLTYALCQAACMAPVTACYSAAGCVFGTVFAAGASPAILACNAAQGVCYAGCAAISLSTPL